MAKRPNTEPATEEVSADSAPSANGGGKKKARVSKKTPKQSSKNGKAAPPGGTASSQGAPPRQPAKKKKREKQQTVELNPTEAPQRRFSLLRDMPAWAVSMAAHMLLIIVMALWEMAVAAGGGLTPLNVTNAEQDPQLLEQMDLKTDENLVPVESAMSSMPQMQNTQLEEVKDKITDVQVNERVGMKQLKVKPLNFANRVAPKDSIIKKMGAIAQGLQGRRPGARREMVRRSGGNDKSEQAVALALQWLARHQRRDGGWSFNHRTYGCGRSCTHPGSMKLSRNGATALALLPFLGAGQTHKQGKYKAVVGRGLLYLARRMKIRNNMGSLVDASEGMMYSHGLGAIALCEAYAMTKDREILPVAQLSLNFSMYAQDPVGGGWRYIPRERGDTSAVGWQLMALKSGHMADLQVNPLVFKKAWFFLNTVQRNNGSEYGYMSNGDGGPGTTAVGLLSRMYLGWQKETPALKQGVEYLANIGPTRNMYYNYYATQVMRHYEGPLWDKWNKVNRDALIKLQVKNGHAKGSWWCCTDDDHGKKSGGRLYNTAFAAMILEVYYRHMPIYGKDASDDDFKL